MQLELQITLTSATNPGSGEGWAGMIDNDVVFDDYGLPYIPARRIRGILKEMALDVVNAFSLCRENAPQLFDEQEIKLLFGEQGMDRTSPLSIDNAYLSGHDEMLPWMKWAQTIAPRLATAERVIESLTHIRHQTAISQDGVAKKHSLRQTRVIDAGRDFTCTLQLDEEKKHLANLLALAVHLTGTLGGKRNRGLGKITCKLIAQENNADLCRKALDDVGKKWNADSPGWNGG